MAGADGYGGADRADLEIVSGNAAIVEPVRVRAPKRPNVQPRADTKVHLRPDWSCRGGLTFQQRAVANLSVASLGLVGLYAPLPLLTAGSALLWAVFACLIIWRFGLILIGAVRWQFHRQRNCNVLDIEKPIYSILIPVFHETEIMDQLAWALRQIVWPEDRLDIQILLEADDPETLIAAEAAAFPPGTRLTIVPPGRVRTKPNALNFGLARARGDFVCIYDAEDRPHPGQMLEAYRAFQAADDHLACVQAPLVADNGRAACIAAHWQLEYAIQFHLLLPAMATLRLPLPIGGTSNHFRRSALVEAGGWDAYNVTEDADLGLRFARLGRQVSVLNLPTYEDAPVTFEVWSAQRSRWIKGFIQTWGVLMRNPRELWRELGLWRFMSVQLALGGARCWPRFSTRRSCCSCSRLCYLAGCRWGRLGQCC